MSTRENIRLIARAPLQFIALIQGFFFQFWEGAWHRAFQIGKVNWYTPKLGNLS